MPQGPPVDQNNKATLRRQSFTTSVLEEAAGFSWSVIYSIASLQYFVVIERGAYFLNESENKTAAAGKSNAWGWIAVAGIIVVAVASQSSTKTPTSPNVQAEGLLGNGAMEAAAPTPFAAAVAEITLKTAARHAGLALGAHGIDGATTYSVNCWASLERKFSLSTTERCAAFDALILSNADVAPDSMPSWFAEVTVAARYQAALTGNSVAVADISDRLERLRVATALQVVTLVKAKPAKPIAVAATGSENDTPDDQVQMDSVTDENALPGE